jgi:hypothetical protein
MSIVRGLPEELRMNAVSLPDGVQSYAVKVVPQNLASITSNTQSITLTANSITEVGVPSTQVIFDIPTVASPNTWVDTAKSMISFRVKYNVACGGTAIAANDLDAQLRGCAWNFFNRIFHTSATGTIIDDVPLTNLANQNHLQWNYDAAEIDSTALAWGFDFQDASTNSLNTNTGHNIATFASAGTANTTLSGFYSYSFPLPSSVIGKFCKGMFPIGKVNKLTLTLQTDTTAPITIRCLNATASATASASFVMDNISLDLQYVDLGEAGSALLGGGSSAVVHGITHRVSQSTVASGTTGAISVLMGLRGSSVRSLTTRCVDGGVSMAASCNGIYDSKAMLANSINYYLGGKERVPPNPLNNISQPATVFSRALHASEAFAERQFKYHGTPREFLLRCASSTAPDASTYQADQRLIDAGSLSNPNYLASWCFAMPLQKISKSKILDGYNFNSSNQYFEANLQIGSTNALALYFIAEMDIIYVIEGGDIMVRS